MHFVEYFENHHDHNILYNIIKENQFSNKKENQFSTLLAFIFLFHIILTKSVVIFAFHLADFFHAGKYIFFKLKVVKDI